MKLWRTVCAAALGAVMLSQSVPNAHAADMTTKYRVYQNDTILQEFADFGKATAYASRFNNAHVEEIGTRKWVWDNFPRYKVYQFGNPLPWGEYVSLTDAVNEAKRWGMSSVRDMQGSGWVWNNYPKPGYRLYQNEVTLDTWEFSTLQAAQAEAARWGDAHVIDESTGAWMWDNLSQDRKAELRKGSPKYRVYQGSYSSDAWQFAYLEDAVNEAQRWADAKVVRIGTKETVHSNVRAYKVKQYNHELQSYMTLDDAIAFASRWDHTKVLYNGSEIWNNYPYYRVYQFDNLIGEYRSIKDSLSLAVRYAHASIRTYEGLEIWDNERRLLFLGWNGVYSDDMIRSQTAPTQGLDMDSPSWFSLSDANGTFVDKSNADTVATLKRQGIAVYPLVTNQFDTKLTTAFLANANAQNAFINTLVTRCAQLGVEGINIDFEDLAGSDRANFTSFLNSLSAAAHAKGLKVSVDLPRGSAAWNAKTAFDHEKIAGIVDYIAIMTYDQYWSGSSKPGSVAGLQWVEQGIQDFLSYGIPRDKLLMGIPFYVREWKLDAQGNLVSNRALLMKSIPKLMTDKKATSTWDNQFNQYKIQYQEDGYTYVFWLEDTNSAKARVDLAKKYELAGVAAWRLGYEPAELWSELIKQK